MITLGLFTKIFGKKEAEKGGASLYTLLSGESGFVPFSGNAWADSTVRAAADAFARRAAVVMPRHIIRKDGRETDATDSLNRLLQYKPNPYSTAYKFYYRIALNYKIFNNAFIYKQWNEMTGKLEALYPLNPYNIDLLEYGGELFLRFAFTNGKWKTVPYSDIIHIGSHFLENDVFGDGNEPLLPVLQTANAFNQSMSKFAEMIAVIRGILSVVGGVKGSDLRAKRDEFVRDNLRVENNGAGVVVTDDKYKYTPISDKQTPIPSQQLEYVKSAIYEYLGTNEKIVQNKESPEEATAYYEGELRPFFTQLSQGFTNGIFTPRERGCGNEIVANINTLSYAKMSEKIQAITFLGNAGALEMDQMLTTLGFPPIGGDEGRRRVQTLNMINAQKADEYQLNEKPKKEETKND